MGIVIAGPTGHIGSKLTAHLLDAGQKVTLLARDPSKVANFVKRGAEVMKGDLGDKGFVLEATRGATTLFWLTPPNMTTEDFRGYQRKIGSIAVEAIKTNSISRVVHLSSVGAHHSEGTGPIAGLHDTEEGMNAVAKNVTHLRPGMFMENNFMSLNSIKTTGSIFAPVSGHVRGPHIATKDIAKVASEVILDTKWTGKRVLTLYGPAELSFDEVAQVLSKVIGRKVSHVTVPAEAAIGAMTGMGVSRDVARLYVEMYQAFESGHISKGLPAQPDVRGKTTLEQWATENFKPAFQ